MYSASKPKKTLRVSRSRVRVGVSLLFTLYSLSRRKPYQAHQGAYTLLPASGVDSFGFVLALASGAAFALGLVAPDTSGASACTPNQPPTRSSMAARGGRRRSGSRRGDGIKGPLFGRLRCNLASWSVFRRIYHDSGPKGHKSLNRQLGNVIDEHTFQSQSGRAAAGRVLR